MKNKSQLKDNNELLDLLSEPLKVGYSWGIQAMAWGGFAFLSGLFFILVQEENFSLFSSSTVIFGLFWFASVAGIFKFSQHITADHQSITVVGWLGKRGINWEEIQQIKIRRYLADMAIYGANKKIILTAPANWRGRDAQKLWDYLNTQIEERNIEVLG